MDPQQKQLLQCVYRALENAGLPMEKASGSRTGVFFGEMKEDMNRGIGLQPGNWCKRGRMYRQEYTRVR